jgi:hypothetical protein
MPPIQPSLRGSLLTGASALALSVSASGAGAQSAGTAKTPEPTLQLWIEGAQFWTGGGKYNVPTLPGLGAPFFSFNPASGHEGALGFDYRWPNQAWHFVFDIRYGRTPTKTASTSFSALLPSFFGGLTTGISSSQGSEHESHFVADFMVGRDIGLGGTSQVQFGVRVVDLQASAQVQQTGTTFFKSSVVTTASGDWHSRFLGAGPRVALTGSIPIVGWWSFDYSGGIAGLIGSRSFEVSGTNNIGGTFYTNQNPTAFIFNADGWVALSYLLSGLKVSGGIRSDYYNSALTTYNINTGALQNIDRLYWGPFVRLTGVF